MRELQEPSTYSLYTGNKYTLQTTTTTTKKPTTTTKKRKPPCFPSTARVSLENGKSVIMSELQVGDRAQTGIDYFRMVQ